MIPSRFLIISTLLAALAPVAEAKIVPASLFTDNAILQRNQPDPVWGTADPNEPITVSFNGQTATTSADATGKWSLKLKPMAAGGPFTMTITGNPGNTVTLNNLLIGEVWICAGQSNMFYPLLGFPNNPLTRAAIPLSADPQLRIAMIPLTPADAPNPTVQTKWVEAGPDTVGNVSAIGYFFVRDLRRALKVPVGLINTPIGGTTAQTWTSREAQEANPALKWHLTELDEYTANYATLL